MNTLEAIAARTSYRGKYLPDPVPREDLRAILEAGLAAPSGCNMQTVSLIAVDDPAILEKIRRATELPFADTAPAMICVLTRPIVAYRNRTFYVQDYGAAIENMLLALVDMGYESCWVEGHITDADRIGRKLADILSVPEEYELVCILPVGRPAQGRTRIEKKPFNERAWFNGFGSPAGPE